MAINPIFGPQLPDLSSPQIAEPAGQTATSTPAVLTLQQLSDVAADLLLSDLAGKSASSTGDPLLDDLNALDGRLQTSSDPSIESSLNQNLNAFLLQQAAASFQASQAMDNQSLGAGSSGSVLGNTSA